MIKINSTQLTILSCVILLLATSCSKAPERKASVELAVDGQTVFKEMDLSPENLILSHYINNLIVENCQLSAFLDTSIKRYSSEQSNHVSIVTPKDSPQGSRVLISESSSKVGFIPTLPDFLIWCSSIGCRVDKSDGQQFQYSLKLLEQLQSEYGMKHDAFWKRYTFQKNGKKSREIIKTAQITNENISCKTLIRHEYD